MVCIDARKEIFNTLSQTYGKACSDVMMIVFDSKFTDKLTDNWGGGEFEAPFCNLHHDQQLHTKHIPGFHFAFTIKEVRKCKTV